MAKSKRTKSERPEKGNYLGAPFVVTHTLMLLCAIVAVALLVIVLLVVLNSPYEKFYFDGRPIVYAFFGLIILFIILLASLVLIQVLNKDKMPTYDEFKRAQNKFAYLKKKSRFPELMDIDRECVKFKKEEISPNFTTLCEFCNDFKDYNASKLKLYYAIEDIRQFVASLATSKIMILQGMSGTGKTSIAVAFGKYVNNLSTVVPVQPMWKEKSDLLGYYNEFTGKFNETTILKKLYEASYSDKLFVIVLDEMNIARVEYYFSEFLSLLELPANSERMLSVASGGDVGDPEKMSHGRILLPDNVWFLGTANNDDSTFAISDKVYDRAMVMNLNYRAEKYKVDRKVESAHFSVTKFNELINAAKEKYPLSDDAKKKLKQLDDYLVATFHITFGNRIMMQIRNYTPVLVDCGGTETQALDDMICKKILRKLEAQNPIYVKTKSVELIAKLDEIFGTDEMKSCIEYINVLANNA